MQQHDRRVNDYVASLGKSKKSKAKSVNNKSKSQRTAASSQGLLDTSNDEDDGTRAKSPVANVLNRHSKMESIYRLVQTPGRPISEWAKTLRMAIETRNLNEEDPQLREHLLSAIMVKLPYRMVKGMPRDSLKDALRYLETYDLPTPTPRSLWRKKGVLTEKPTIAFAQWKDDFREVMPDDKYHTL